MIENLESATPLPVYFTTHDMQEGTRSARMVKIFERARPLHYLDQEYLVISFPSQTVQAAAAFMEARTAVAAARKKRVPTSA